MPWSASRSAAVALAVALAASASPAAALVRPSGTGPLPVTAVTVNGAGGDRLYQGVGAVLGGGGNARYLMDYPEPERGQILDYLFKPGYGAALQLLKLEIGGGANSTDGAEPSVEPVRGQVNCDAGDEFSIARQAVARNPGIRLYGLQWTAPGWVGQGTGSVFTSADIGYLLTWLGCAARHGLTISYLGGWNESDDGTHAAWFHRLRLALDAAGYRSVQLVAADSNPTWEYVSNPADPDIAILGTHDVCGYPTGVAGPATRCYAPAAAIASGQPLWASELGAMDAGAQPGCVQPCAPAMDRAVVRGYLDARLDRVPGVAGPRRHAARAAVREPRPGHRGPALVRALPGERDDLGHRTAHPGRLAALAGQPGRLAVPGLGQRVPAGRPRRRLVRDPGPPRPAPAGA